jgi:Family of unknown function (DUF6527)
MKAQPLKQIDNAYQPCLPEEATHIRLSMPCPISDRVLPIITKGDRKNSPCWSWNGDTEKPTLKPSILTRTETYKGIIVCHSFVTEGKAHFLSNCTHDLAGQTVDLLEVN